MAAVGRTRFVQGSWLNGRAVRDGVYDSPVWAFVYHGGHENRPGLATTLESAQTCLDSYPLTP